MTDGRGTAYPAWQTAGETVAAPVAPGMIMPVGIERWNVLGVSMTAVDVELRPCTVALDGERAFSLKPGEEAHIQLNPAGPRVVLIEETLREAAISGVFRESRIAE